MNISVNQLLFRKSLIIQLVTISGLYISVVIYDVKNRLFLDVYFLIRQFC